MVKNFYNLKFKSNKKCPKSPVSDTMTRKYYINTYISLVYQLKLSTKQTSKQGQQSFPGGETVLLPFSVTWHTANTIVQAQRQNLGTLPASALISITYFRLAQCPEVKGARLILSFSIDQKMNQGPCLSLKLWSHSGLLCLRLPLFLPIPFLLYRISLRIFLETKI